MADSTNQNSNPGPSPRISVVVPCRNESGHVSKCLTGLLSLEAPPGGFEVIVADGQSDDGTRQILARLEKQINEQQMADGGQKSSGGSPVVRVIDNPGRMTACGLNAAIQAARGDIIVRADAHSEYAPDYLLRCLEVLQQTGADNVGGPAQTRAGGYRQQAIAAAYHSPFSVGGARFHDTDYEGYVDTVTYGCWPRKTFEKFGLFDEQLVRNQDDEHNLRITRGGGKVYQSPAIKSWYQPRGSLSELFRQYMQYGYWKVLVIQKHKLPASWRHLVPGMFLMALALLFAGSVLCSLLSASTRLPAAMSYLLWMAFFLVLGTYVLVVLVASILTSVKTKWKLFAILPLVFGCYHFGYGLGFLRGVVDFVVLRRGASKSFAKLTRPSAQKPRPVAP
jgi:succinoglycan biosynthesis protein ExoA